MSDAPTPTPTPDTRWSPGILAMLGFFIGAGMLLMGALSIVNALLDLNLSLGGRGSAFALPRFVNSAIPIVVSGVVILGGTAAGSYLIHLGKRTSSWAVRIALILGVLGTLGAGSYYGYWVLEWVTFESWAVAYAANGSVEAMEGALDAGVTEEVASECMWRAIQFDEAEAVDALLARGISPLKRYDDDDPWCMLEDADPAVLEVAAARGWSATCVRQSVGSATPR